MSKYSLKDILPGLKPAGIIAANLGGKGTTTSPGYLELGDASGTSHYLQVDANNVLRVGTSEPSSDSALTPISGTGIETYIDVTLTSAQILALNATPITVIAAPGASKAVVVTGAVAYKAAGTAYGGIAAGEDVSLRYTDGSGAMLAVFEATGFLDQATAQTRYAYPQSAVATASVEVTPVANAAIVAHMVTGEITTGTSDLVLRIFYRVIPTVL